MTARGLADVHEDGETCTDPECSAPHFRGRYADQLFRVRKAWERGACGHASPCRTVVVPECVLWRGGRIPEWLGPLLTPAKNRAAPASSSARSFSLGEKVMYLREDLGGRAAIPCEVSSLFLSSGAVQIRMTGVNLEQPRFFMIDRESQSLLLSPAEFAGLLAGTTTPVRSVPSEQWGNLALNFCTRSPEWDRQRCHLNTTRHPFRYKWHPCQFATLNF